MKMTNESFTIRLAEPDDDAMIATLVVEGFLDKFRPIFGRKVDRAFKVMKDWVQLEHNLGGQSLVAEMGSGIAATVGVRTTGTNDAELAQGLWDSLQKHLGWFHAMRAAALLSYPRYTLQPTELYIERLVVSPGYRRLGMARALLEAAEKLGRQEGKETAGLHVSGVNFPALKLYEDLGFEEAHRQRSIVTAFTMGIRDWLYLEKPL